MRPQSNLGDPQVEFKHKHYSVEELKKEIGGLL